MITNRDSQTRIDEIAGGIYRISTPTTKVPGGFTFNQFLIVDDDPLLFHTGLRQLFPLEPDSKASAADQPAKTLPAFPAPVLQPRSLEPLDLPRSRHSQKHSDGRRAQSAVCWS
jgi:hypothetical protein